MPSAVLIDLTREIPALEEYDAIIVGAGVRMGAINKAAKEFLEKNKTALATKKYGIFFTNCFEDTTEEILANSISTDLREGAVWVGSVGGVLDMDKLKGIDKVVAKAAAKAVKEGQKINEELDNTALSELAACFE